MNNEINEIRVSQEFLQGVLEVVAKYPAAWAVITDFADYDGRYYRKGLEITGPAAKKIYNAMKKAGIMDGDGRFEEGVSGLTYEGEELRRKLLETLNIQK